MNANQDQIQTLYLANEESKLIKINFREPGFVTQILELQRQD